MDSWRIAGDTGGDCGGDTVAKSVKVTSRFRSRAETVRSILLTERLAGGLALDRRELLRQAGISWRTLRAIGEYWRAQGVMVLSEGEGYFLALRSEEMDAPIAYRRSYAMTILKDLRHCRQARRRMIDAETYAGKGVGV